MLIILKACRELRTIARWYMWISELLPYVVTTWNCCDLSFAYNFIFSSLSLTPVCNCALCLEFKELFWKWILGAAFLDISVKKCCVIIKVGIFGGEEGVLWWNTQPTLAVITVIGKTNKRQQNPKFLIVLLFFFLLLWSNERICLRKVTVSSTSVATCEDEILALFTEGKKGWRWICWW